MERSSREIRADRIFLEAIRDRSGRWIVGANACAVGLFLLSPWEIGEVLVVFWLEAGVVAVVFAVFVALAPVSGPTLIRRLGRVALWALLAGGFLALTGTGVSWTVMAGPGAGAFPADFGPPSVVPPIAAVLGPAPWIALGWIVFRSVAAFSDLFVGRRFERGIGLAAARFFVVYLPVLAVTAGLFVLTVGALGRVLPVLFLVVLTYYELVLTLKLLPLMEEERKAAPTPGEERKAAVRRAPPA